MSACLHGCCVFVQVLDDLRDCLERRQQQQLAQQQQQRQVQRQAPDHDSSRPRPQPRIKLALGRVQQLAIAGPNVEEPPQQQQDMQVTQASTLERPVCKIQSGLLPMSSLAQTRHPQLQPQPQAPRMLSSHPSKRPVTHGAGAEGGGDEAGAPFLGAQRMMPPPPPPVSSPSAPPPPPARPDSPSIVAGRNALGPSRRAATSLPTSGLPDPHGKPRSRSMNGVGFLPCAAGAPGAEGATAGGLRGGSSSSRGETGLMEEQQSRKSPCRSAAPPFPSADDSPDPDRRPCARKPPAVTIAVTERWGGRTPRAAALAAERIWRSLDPPQVVVSALASIGSTPKWQQPEGKAARIPRREVALAAVATTVVGKSQVPLARGGTGGSQQEKYPGGEIAPGPGPQPQLPGTDSPSDAVLCNAALSAPHYPRCPPPPLQRLLPSADRSGDTQRDQLHGNSQQSPQPPRNSPHEQHQKREQPWEHGQGPATWLLPLPTSLSPGKRPSAPSSAMPPAMPSPQPVLKTAKRHIKHSEAKARRLAPPTQRTQDLQAALLQGNGAGGKRDVVPLRDQLRAPPSVSLRLWEEMAFWIMRYLKVR